VRRLVVRALGPVLGVAPRWRWVLRWLLVGMGVLWLGGGRPGVSPAGTHEAHGGAEQVVAIGTDALYWWQEPSGMQVVFFGVGADVVSFQVLWHSGAMDDPPDRAGLAMVAAEHLVRCTAQMDRLAFEDRLGDLGARVELQVGESATLLRVEVLAEHAEAMLVLLGEMVDAPCEDEAVLAALFTELDGREAFRLDDDQRLARTLLASFAFGAHPYGRDPLARSESRQRIRMADVARYRDAHLHMSNAVLAVSGPVDAALLVRLRETWQQFRVGERPVRAQRALPRARGTRLLLVDKANRSQHQVLVGLLLPPPTAENGPAFELVRVVLGGTFSSRLVRELRSERGWTYMVRAERWRYPESALLLLQTFVAPDRSVQTLGQMLHHLNDLGLHGMREGEFEAAQRYFVENWWLRFERPVDVALEAARFLHYGLSPEALQQVPERVAALEKGEVDAAFRSLVTEGDLSLLVLCSAALFESAFLRMPGLRSLAIVPYDT